jgi:hypothetical protein
MCQYHIYYIHIQPIKNIQKTFQEVIMAPLITFAPIDLIFVKHIKNIFL